MHYVESNTRNEDRRDTVTLAERHRQVLAPVVPMETEIPIERGDGCYLVGRDGRRYLDLVMGIAVNALGYGHPRVLEAVHRQVDRHMHVYSGSGYQEPVVAYAEALRQTVGPDYRVFFGNSGAEAVEAAVKVARLVTGRPAVIAFRGSFHGRTLGALSLTASAARYRSAYEPLVPSVYHVDYPAPTRLGLDEAAALAHVQQQLDQLFLLEVEPSQVAAVVVEPIQGEGGYVIPPPGFLPWLREVTRRHGILLAVDEVQTGLGRTGRLWAYAHDGIEPDLVMMGKAIGGGLPLSALVGRADIMDRWAGGLHGSTFGGNPVSCAAGLATLTAIQEEHLVERAARLGAEALAALAPLAERPDVREVRGRGLMLAVEFSGPDPGSHVQRVIDKSLEQGIYLHPAGVRHEVIRFMPPLNIPDQVLLDALAQFAEIVADTAVVTR
jgi:4-aminobutyrate aminotransferase